MNQLAVPYSTKLVRKQRDLSALFFCVLGILDALFLCIRYCNKFSVSFLKMLNWLRTVKANETELARRGLSAREEYVANQIASADRERRRELRIEVGLDQPIDDAGGSTDEEAITMLDAEFDSDEDEDGLSYNEYREEIGKLITGTWYEKSRSIFFFLHPSLGNKDYELSAKLFGWKFNTFRGWIDKTQFHPKWKSFVSKLKLGEVIDALPESVREKYSSLDRDSVITDLDMENSIRTKKGKVIFTYSGNIRDNRSVSKQAGKHNSEGVYVNRKRKSVGGGRNRKWQDQSVFVNHIVQKRWETGNPISRPELTSTVLKEFSRDQEDPFFLRMIDPNNPKAMNNFSTWLTRTLKYWSWSERKKSISQTVPKNWYTLAVNEAMKIRDFILEIQPDVCINADEVFFNFYPEDDKILARTNSKRIGSNKNPSNDKAGCTVMMGMEMFSSSMVPPFLIFNGEPLSNPRAILAKMWLNYTGYSTVRFQPNHWMDTEAAIEYLKMLLKTYPGKKILLLWDFVGAHISDETVQFMRLNGIYYLTIEKCITSIMQPCDIYCNKPVKQRVKVQYGEWKISQDVPIGGKYKVDRKTFVKWVESAVKEFEQQVRMRRGIYKSFQTCGIDMEDAELGAFNSHLDKLKCETVYGTLLSNQAAINLQ